ncbi:MAG: 16S rRNA (cytosine(1402)-N(4))-methyltransferase RsmH [Chlorobi bacterium]|nr:16S rRNA (cytosine(1402)-N(4))-methyltransferase RsmH [Chlorobiota bacterium]
MNDRHIPVLLDKSIEYLITNKSGIYFDATLGFGGHSGFILSKLDKPAKLIGTDKDRRAFDFCLEKFAGEDRASFYNTGFTNIDAVAKLEHIDGFDGIIADLGVSSFQLDDESEGFTYRTDAPLDLRMSKENTTTAADAVNNLSYKELTKIFFDFGEDPNSRKIANAIIQERKKKRIETTFELRKIIENVVPSKFVMRTLSRIFQALRIYVNDELEELKIFLSKSTELLKSGGRLVVLTYHSLEDRIVKEFFKFESLDCVCPPEFPVCVCDKTARLKILTKRPVTADDEELKRNKRARSGKLRAAEKI